MVIKVIIFVEFLLGKSGFRFVKILILGVVGCGK